MQVYFWDKEVKLQEKFWQVKKYFGEVDDVYYWVNDFRNEFKVVLFCGVFLEFFKKQFDVFMVKFEELEFRIDVIQGFIVKG